MDSTEGAAEAMVDVGNMGNMGNLVGKFAEPDVCLACLRRNLNLSLSSYPRLSYWATAPPRPPTLHATPSSSLEYSSDLDGNDKGEDQIGAGIRQRLEGREQAAGVKGTGSVTGAGTGPRDGWEVSEGEERDERRSKGGGG